MPFDSDSYGRHLITVASLNLSLYNPNMKTELIDTRGVVVNVGDVVKCLANEPWVFVGIIDDNIVQVMWEENFYDMPTLAIGCRVVKRDYNLQ